MSDADVRYEVGRLEREIYTAKAELVEKLTAMILEVGNMTARTTKGNGDADQGVWSEAYRVARIGIDQTETGFDLVIKGMALMRNCMLLEERGDYLQCPTCQGGTIDFKHYRENNGACPKCGGRRVVRAKGGE